LTQQQDALERQVRALAREVAAIDEIIDAPDAMPMAANS
jgi:hypothetical protein